MAHPSPLAVYVADALARRGETPEEFAHRVGINSSGLYKLLRGVYTAPTHRVLERIAAGLSMSPAELLAAAEPVAEADPVEQLLRERIPEMREALRDIPREFWGPVLKSTLGHAVEGIRDMADLLTGRPRPPVSVGTRRRVRAQSALLTEDEIASKQVLADSYSGVHQPLVAGLAYS